MLTGDAAGYVVVDDAAVYTSVANLELYSIVSLKKAIVPRIKADSDERGVAVVLAAVSDV